MNILEWLLDADPAIRWQVLRDLAGAEPDEVAAERARVATEGWGAQLLALQGADGRWDGGTYRPGWVDDEKPFFDARPSVSADGRRIVFNRQKGETIGIFVLDLAPASEGRH